MLTIGYFCVLIIILFGNESFASIGDSIEPRIIGGVVSNISKEKYLVQLLTSETVCGGSLIHPLWVITAAHCVYGLPAQRFLVYGNASNLAGPHAVIRRVTFVTRHPNYKPSTMAYDVGAVKLKSAMTGVNIATIPFATSLPNPRTLLKVSGWGYLSANANSVARRVHSVRVPLWRHSICRQSYQNIRVISESMICAGKPRLRDSCSGDSGGPLVFKGDLVGIVSWGYSCATAKPGVYTNVLTIKSWFNRIVSNNS